MKKLRTKEMGQPSTGAVVRAVGWVTFQEVIKDKILYNIGLCGFLLFGFGFLASRLTSIRPDRIILDFGMSAVSLSCGAIAIFTGSTLMAKEFERRTIQVALTRPISRPQFILGKFAGLGGVLALNWFLLSLVYILLLKYASYGDSGPISIVLFESLFLLLIQSLMISGIAVLFSTFSTASLSAICTVGLYLVGTNISQLRLLAAKTKSSFGSSALNGVATFLPNLEYFNLGTKVTYGIPVSWQFIATSTLYGMVSIAVLLAIAGLLIHAREI